MQTTGNGRTGIVIPQEYIDRARDVGLKILREPFAKRTWQELFYFCISGLLVGVATVYIGVTFLAGSFLLVTFVGLFLIGACVRGAHGIGGWYRSLAASTIGEHIEEPAAFSARPGVFGWLQSALRDRAGWRSIAYTLVKIPLTFFGVLVALVTWVDAAIDLLYPVISHPPATAGFPAVFGPGYFSVARPAFIHGAAIVLTGVLLLFIAPWPMRLVVYADRLLMRAMLGPDAVTARTRSLEAARTQTVDSSAATLRRIERDLHDGTQAQLVAIAMRLGQAKEVLAGTATDDDLAEARRLVEDAHKGAKDAIVDLRDLARGIHPPALDTGLEGALATLTARAAIPTELTISIKDRPTPAIEAIAYFLVAELLANVAQHAGASRATVTCAQHGLWLRVAVRDDGHGGARPATTGSRSSGLAGLAERVRAVDGHLDITSPDGGPTVVTADLPLHP